MAVHVTKAYTCKVLRSPRTHRRLSLQHWTPHSHYQGSSRPPLACLHVCLSVLQLTVRLSLSCDFSTSRGLPHPSNSYRVGLHERCMFLQCAFPELSVLNVANSSPPPHLSRVSFILATALACDFPKRWVLHARNSLASEFPCSQQQL